MDDRSAVLIFEQGKVSREMRFSEFEAILDAFAPMPELAEQRVQAVYVQLDERLLVRALVFFYIAFDSEGFADHRWNIPLQQLADNSANGPDLGGGPIRLACRSQCCIEWHKNSLWDPELGPKSSHFVGLHNALKNNRLGFYAQDNAIPTLNESTDNKGLTSSDYEQRLAQAQKEHQLRIAAQSDAHDAEIQALKVKFQAAMRELRLETENLQSKLHQETQNNGELKSTIENQATKIKGLREYFEHKLDTAKTSDAANLEDVRKGFELELDARISAVTTDLNEQLQLKNVTLMYRDTQCSGLEDEVRRLVEEKQALLANSGNQLLERLHSSGISFVSFQPGYGHMTLPIDDIPGFIEDTDDYVAEKCGVDKLLYRAWQDHYKRPVCHAVAKGGLSCDQRVERIDRPADFLLGESDRCSSHKPAGASE